MGISETEHPVCGMGDRDHIVMIQNSFIALADFLLIDVCPVTRKILLQKEEKMNHNHIIIASKREEQRRKMVTHRNINGIQHITQVFCQLEMCLRQLSEHFLPQRFSETIIIAICLSAYAECVVADICHSLK